MKVHTIIFGGILVIGILISGCGAEPTSQEQAEANMPNPASVYCEEQGGRLEIRSDANGQYGVCIFEDGSECDEWAFFRGECAPGGQVNPPTSEAPATGDVQAEQPAYTNETYGFTLNPPSDWVIEEHGDYLLLKHPGYAFFLGYQWANEDPKPFRTGMPAGEFVEGGEALLLGQPIPRKILVYEGKNKVVDYGGRIKIGDLVIVMYLDGQETETVPYQDIDIPPEVIAAADQIIASFGFSSGKTPAIERNP